MTSRWQWLLHARYYIYGTDLKEIDPTLEAMGMDISRITEVLSVSGMIPLSEEDIALSGEFIKNLSEDAIIAFATGATHWSAAHTAIKVAGVEKASKIALILDGYPVMYVNWADLHDEVQKILGKKTSHNYDWTERIIENATDIKILMIIEQGD